MRSLVTGLEREDVNSIKGIESLDPDDIDTILDKEIVSTEDLREILQEEALNEGEDVKEGPPMWNLNSQTLNAYLAERKYVN